ncbi:MAG: hypothetical protein AAFW60_00475 [Pseudomonadota bacterium]
MTPDSKPKDDESWVTIDDCGFSNEYWNKRVEAALKDGTMIEGEIVFGDYHPDGIDYYLVLKSDVGDEFERSDVEKIRTIGDDE